MTRIRPEMVGEQRSGSLMALTVISGLALLFACVGAGVLVRRFRGPETAPGVAG